MSVMRKPVKGQDFQPFWLNTFKYMYIYMSMYVYIYVGVYISTYVYIYKSFTMGNN